MVRSGWRGGGEGLQGCLMKRDLSLDLDLVLRVDLGLDVGSTSGGGDPLAVGVVDSGSSSISSASTSASASMRLTTSASTAFSRWARMWMSVCSCDSSFFSDSMRAREEREERWRRMMARVMASGRTNGNRAYMACGARGIRIR